MTIQFSLARRTARAAASEATIGPSPRIQIRSGAAPANCAAADAGTLLAEFALGADWSTQAAGVLTFSDVPLSAVAIAAGSAAHYRIKDLAGTTCHEQGTVTVTGGGGDMTVDNPSIGLLQTVYITGWTQTEGNA